MSKSTFYSLKVSEIQHTTKDCVVVSFDVPQDLYESFQFIQGQYLTLKTEINGEEVRRSYSLCSSPIDKKWSVGIKKVHQGKFSTFANEVLKIGDVIDVMLPQGNFYIPIVKEKKRNYVGFAAGSGITPIISIIKTHLISEPKSTFKLFYINQTVSSIILKEELEALKNQFIDRFEIFYFLTKQHRDIPLLNGRLDEEKLTFIADNICDFNNIDHIFSCGPESMVFMIQDFLEGKGVPKESIHFELFGTGASNIKNMDAAIKEREGNVCKVSLIEGGQQMFFDVTIGGDNILDAALINAADLPYACKGGVCSTCKAKLVEGEVSMEVSYGLEEDEIKAGYILTCQAYPKTEKIVVDFDL